LLWIDVDITKINDYIKNLSYDYVKSYLINER
jgi:hypothetical protein